MVWPNFNVADSLLVCGGGLLVLHALRNPAPKRDHLHPERHGGLTPPGILDKITVSTLIFGGSNEYQMFL